jgi:hypothetical protein
MPRAAVAVGRRRLRGLEQERAVPLVEQVDPSERDRPDRVAMVGQPAQVHLAPAGHPDVAGGIQEPERRQGPQALRGREPRCLTEWRAGPRIEEIHRDRFDRECSQLEGQRHAVGERLVRGTHGANTVVVAVGAADIREVAARTLDVVVEAADAGGGESLDLAFPQQAQGCTDVDVESALICRTASQITSRSRSEGPRVLATMQYFTAPSRVQGSSEPILPIMARAGGPARPAGSPGCDPENRASGSRRSHRRLRSVPPWHRPLRRRDVPRSSLSAGAP